MNLDRNETNILVFDPKAAEVDDTLSFYSEDTIHSGLTRNKNLQLIPIDHGLSIPDTLEVCTYDLQWLSYSQANEPFSERSLEYIKAIDIEKDIQMLEKLFKFRP